MLEENGTEENISVSVRIRPISADEVSNGFSNIWKVNENSLATLPEVSVKINHTFDHIFDGTAITEDVFDKVGSDLVTSVLQGMNGTIFAYGQTASGKTHTMEGNEGNPGIMSLAVDKIFDMIEEMSNFQFMIHVSYIEVFNEQIKDLLADSDQNLRLREDPEKGFFVDNLSTHSVVSIDEIMELKKKGERKRHVGTTNMNLHSSRSHTIFTLKIEMRDTRVFEENELEQKYKKRRSVDNTELYDLCFGVLIGKLNLVDLAGSENAKLTQAEGDRLTEAANINKSLLSLSRVISQLSSNSNQFINWRDSKLTQILQPSLGGNCKTCVICCIRAGKGFLEESKSTMNFASKTKRIKNKVTINEVLDGEGEIQKLKTAVKSLEAELQDHKAAQSEKIDLKNEIMRLKALLISGGHDNDEAERQPRSHLVKKRKNFRKTWAPGKRKISFAPGALAQMKNTDNRSRSPDHRKSFVTINFEDDSCVTDNSIFDLESKSAEDELIKERDELKNRVKELEREKREAQTHTTSESNEKSRNSILELELLEERDRLNQRIQELEGKHENYSMPRDRESGADLLNSGTFCDETILSKKNKSTHNSFHSVDLIEIISLEQRITELEEENERLKQLQPSASKAVDIDADDVEQVMNYLLKAVEVNHGIFNSGQTITKEERMEEQLKLLEAQRLTEKESAEELKHLYDSRVKEIEATLQDTVKENKLKVEQLNMLHEDHKQLNELIEDIKHEKNSFHELNQDLELKNKELLEKISEVKVNETDNIEVLKEKEELQVRVIEFEKQQKILLKQLEEQNTAFELERKHNQTSVLSIEKENTEKIADLIQVNDELREAVTKLEEDNENLQKESSTTLKEKYIKLETEFNLLKNINVNLTAELSNTNSSAEVNNESLHKSLTQVKFQVDLKSQEIEKLTVKLEEKENDNKRLIGTLDDMQQKLKENELLKTQEHENNDEKYNKLLSELRGQEIKLENLVTVNNSLKEKNSNLIKQIEDIEEDKTATIEHDEIVKQNETIQQRQLESIHALELKVKRLETEKKENIEVVKLLETNLSKEQDTLFELRQNSETCKKCIQKDEDIEQLNSMKETLEYNLTSTEKHIAKYKGKEQTHEQEMSELTNRLQRVIESKKLLEADLIASQEQIKQHNENNFVLEEKITEFNEMLKEKTQIEDELKQVISEKSLLALKRDDLEAEYKALQLQVKSAGDVNVILKKSQDKVIELNKIIEDKAKRLEKLESSKITRKAADKINKILKDSKELRTWKSELVEYIKANFDVEDTFLIRDIKVLFQELKEDRQKYLKQNAEYRSQFKAMKTSLTKVTDTTSTKVEQLEKKNEQLELDLRKVKETYKKFQSKANFQEKQIADLEKENNDMFKAYRKQLAGSKDKENALNFMNTPLKDDPDFKKMIERTNSLTKTKKGAPSFYDLMQKQVKKFTPK